MERRESNGKTKISSKPTQRNATADFSLENASEEQGIRGSVNALEHYFSAELYLTLCGGGDSELLQ